MTNTLRKKMLRDLRSNFVQFLAIFIMCFFAMFILQGFDASTEGYGRSIDKYYLETDFSDLVLTSDGFTQDDLIRVKSDPRVKTAELRASIVGRVRLSEEKKIEFNFINENNISRMYLYEGVPYETGMNGIWIDRDFSSKQNISVGDNLSLTVDGVEFTETVRGIMDNPDHVYYIVDDTFSDVSRGAYGYAFLDSGEYPGKKLTYSNIYVKLKDIKNQFYMTENDEDLIKSVGADLSSFFSKNRITFTTKMKEGGYQSVSGDLDSNMTLEKFFPVLFIVIAILGIITTMTRLVMKQRTIIGALKAFGFSRLTVTLHYMSYSVVVSLLGGITGAIAGWYILGVTLDRYMKDYYIIPGAGMMISSRIVLVMILLVLLSGLTCFLSCRKLLMKRASEILRPEPPKESGAGALEKSPFWNHLSFATKWNIREIYRNRIRTAAGILGITLTSGLMLTAFGANDLVKKGETWQFHELIAASYLISFSADADYGTVYDYSREFKGQMIEENEAELFCGNKSIVWNLTVMDQGNLFRFQDGSGRYVTLPEKGIAISRKAAEQLDAEIGDLVSFRLSDGSGSGSGRIELIYTSPGTQGIAMRRSFYESLGLSFAPNSLYTCMTVPLSYAADREEIASVISKDSLIRSLHRRNRGTADETLYTMTIAIIIGIVVMYNLGVLSFIEKIREIATLKVLGFETAKIRWILQQQNIFITGTGTALGLSLGLKMLTAMMSSLSIDEDHIYMIKPQSYLLAFLLSFVLSLIVNALISAKVKDIDMVEALKGVE